MKKKDLKTQHYKNLEQRRKRSYPKSKSFQGKSFTLKVPEIRMALDLTTILKAWRHWTSAFNTKERMILNLELYTQPNYQSVARIEYKHFQTCKVRNFGVNVQQNEGNKSGKKGDMWSRKQDLMQKRTAGISQGDSKGKLPDTSCAEGLDIKQSRLESSEGNTLRRKWDLQIAWCGWQYWEYSFVRVLHELGIST